MITSEMGMPVVSQKSVEKCAWTCEYYADNLQFYADEPVDADGDKHYVRYEPRDNHAGNAMELSVLASVPYRCTYHFGWQHCSVKHSRTTTGCALLIEQLFTDAGFPAYYAQW